MSADSFDIRRIDLDADISVWVPDEGTYSCGPEPPSTAARVVRLHPVAAAVAAVVGLAAVLRLGLTPAGLLAAWTLAVLTILAAIDLEVRLLPNRIVFPAIVGALAWQGVFFTGRLVECVIAGLCAGLVLLLPSLVQRGAVGMGDVKVAAFLGVVLGADVIAALLVGSLLSAPVALALLLLKGKRARRTALPFGPFLALGAAVVLLV
jgi:leader peptidase (prepilin peptidase)/N-methyltransferase